ncbi:MAG: hypothetical protein M3O46_09810 [Myxococcota bacterium]|nr:hypothetical protein [Myxococcota bacterium]
MSKRRISRALPIATASTLAWAVACSSAGNAAPGTTVGGPVSDAGHGFTRLDDMEGTTIPWTGPAETTPEWGTNTGDASQNDHLLPVPGSTWS